MELYAQKLPVDGMDDLLPSEFYLSQNYPNPFSERTTIKFCVAYRTRVVLRVFNSEGRMVKTLLDEEKEASTYEVTLVASQLPGGRHGPPEGSYIYELRAGDFVLRKRMILFRQELMGIDI